MRVFFTGFLVFLAFAFTSRWYFVCEVRNNCGDEPVATRPLTLSLEDNGKVILRDYEQFGFAPGSFEPDMTDNNREFLEKVAEYLKQNPDKKITLKGGYLASEKEASSGIYDNLGVARASAVERLLEKLGIDEERISIDYEEITGETLSTPIGFSSYNPTPDEYAKLEYKFTDNTFSDANFDFGSADFRPGEECILYADSVKTFLDDHPDMILTITGHTDSIDTEKFNYDLGLKRAKSAAVYFRELGVKADINIESKGETQPVAPNTLPGGTDNKEGRQKNRRVNFKIGEKTIQ